MEFAECGSIFCYFATSEGVWSLRLCLCLFCVLFAFAECGMWNVECGDGGIFINPTRVCKFRKGKLLLRGWQLTQQTHLSRFGPSNDAAGNS